jgi:hypothetical protein
MWPFRKRAPKPVKRCVIHSICGPAAREIAELYVKYHALERDLDLVARMDLWAKIHTVIPHTQGHSYTVEAYLGSALCIEVREEWVEGALPREVHVIDTTPKSDPEHA